MSISNYSILKEMGKGAYSTVYLVKNKTDNIYYAMKSVKMNDLSSKEKENAINEIKILSSNTHPNIIAFKESFYDENTQTLNLIMEYADEGDLECKIKTHIKNKTFFEEKTIWKFLIQITEALKVLHDNKIMHRDLKTANIFIKNGQAKLGDMNVSKVVKTGMLYTQIGTPYYASPEVWNDKPYEYKSDIWSMGCVLYEICSLLPPFRGKNLDQLFKSIMKGTFDPIPKFYSSELATVIHSMIKVSSTSRPSCESILNNPFVLSHKKSNCQNLTSSGYLPYKLINSAKDQKENKKLIVNKLKSSVNINIKESKDIKDSRQIAPIERKPILSNPVNNVYSHRLLSAPKVREIDSNRLLSAPKAKDYDDSNKYNIASSSRNNQNLIYNSSYSKYNSYRSVEKIDKIESKYNEESMKNKEIIRKLCSARTKPSQSETLLKNEESKEHKEVKLLSSDNNNQNYRKIITYENVLSRNKPRNVYETKTAVNNNPLFSNRDGRYISTNTKKYILNSGIESKSNIKSNLTNVYETHYNKLPLLQKRDNQPVMVNSESKERKWMISPMKILPSKIYKK